MVECFNGTEEFLNDLDSTQKFNPKSHNFSKSVNFLQKIVSQINKNRLAQCEEKTKSEVGSVLSLNQMLFENERQLKNFEKMFNGLRRTKEDISNSYSAFKEFEGMDKDLIEHVVSFLSDFVSMSGRSGKINKFIQDISQKEIEKFPVFMREVFKYFEMESISTSGNESPFPEVDFLDKESSFENYKNFFFILKVIENALIFLNNDFQFSNILDSYAQKRKLGENGDKKMLENSFTDIMYKFTKYYKNTVFGTRTITYGGKEIEFGVEFETNVRFKPVKSLIKKGIVGEYDPNSIHDIFGCMFYIRLPELEAELENTKEKQKLREKIHQEKYEVLKDLIAYLPSIVKNNRSMDVRIRDYLKKEKENKASGEDYKAVHITFSKFQLNQYEFSIPIEIKLMIEDSPHEDFRKRQFEQISDNFFLKYNMKDFFGYLLLYYILLQKGNYTYDMFKFSDDIIDENKKKEEIIEENEETLHSLIMDYLLKMEMKNFKEIIQQNIVEETFLKFRYGEDKKKKKKKSYSQNKLSKEENKSLDEIKGFFEKNLLKDLQYRLEDEIKTLEEKKQSAKIYKEKLEVVKSITNE